MANFFIRNGLTAALSAAYLLFPIGSQAADISPESDILPSANAGECYAKVSVPAVYKTEALTIVLKQAYEKIETVPAKFVETTEHILVKEASTGLLPVDPVYDEVEEQVLISPASDLWVRSGPDSTVPASSGILSDLQASGVDLQSVPTGSCFYEFHKAAVYQEVEDKYMVEEASEQITVLPAKFRTSEQQITIKPEYRQLQATDAVIKSVTEKVLVEPAHRDWKKGRGPIERIDNSTGEIMCLVDVPARYEEIQKEVVQSAAKTTSTIMPAEFTKLTVEKLAQAAVQSTVSMPAEFVPFNRRKKISDANFSWLSDKNADESEHGEATGSVLCHREMPAVYKTFKRKVVKEPARVTTVDIPAVYKAVKVQKLESDAIERRIEVQPVETELFKRVKVSDTRLEWRPVLCETNMTRDVVTDIQRALNERGYSAGKVDGILGQGTLRALEKFQSDKNLAQGGLTYTTIKALGVEL